jgi:hypothetical protein
MNPETVTPTTCAPGASVAILLMTPGTMPKAASSAFGNNDALNNLICGGARSIFSIQEAA